MEEKLKTIKDMDLTCEDVCPDICTTVGMIRGEAIKWIKNLQKRRTPITGVNEGKINWIKMFFGIEESEL